MHYLIYPRHYEKIRLRTLSETTGLSFEELTLIFRNGDLWELPQNRRRAGLEYGLTGTPGFVINNDVYLGNIPAEILADYLKN